MSSTICGLCNLSYHVKNYGWIWSRGVGYHRWQEPTKEQITARMRKKYGLSPGDTYLPTLGSEK